MNCLKKFRLTSHLQQADLVKILNCSPAYYSNVETGNVFISLKKYYTILRYAIDHNMEYSILTNNNLNLYVLSETLVYHNQNNYRCKIDDIECINGIELQWFREINGWSTRNFAKLLHISENELKKLEQIREFTLDDEILKQIKSIPDIENKDIFMIYPYLERGKKPLFEYGPDLLNNSFNAQLFSSVYNLFGVTSDDEVIAIADEYKQLKQMGRVSEETIASLKDTIVKLSEKLANTQ